MSLSEKTGDSKDTMRLKCYFCGKSVSNEVPQDTTIRAVLVCPECIQAEKVLIPE